VLKERRALDWFIHNFTGFVIHVMQLKHVLGDIHTHCRTLHVGPSRCLEKFAFSTFWHIDVVDL
jgi:hypothetical protein